MIPGPIGLGTDDLKMEVDEEDDDDEDEDMEEVS